MTQVLLIHSFAHNWHSRTCLQLHNQKSTSKVDLQRNGIPIFTVRDMRKVPIFYITFFEVNVVHDIYPSISHLLESRILPTCSLSVSNYATVVTALFDKQALLRVMWSCTSVTRLGLSSALTSGTLSLLWWREGALVPNLTDSSLFTDMPGPCSPCSTWTSLLACSIAKYFWTARSKEKSAGFTFNISVIIFESRMPESNQSQSRLALIASTNLHSVAKCFKMATVADWLTGIPSSII